MKRVVSELSFFDEARRRMDAYDPIFTATEHLKE